jgi:hypothetical protein
MSDLHIRTGWIQARDGLPDSLVNVLVWDGQIIMMGMIINETWYTTEEADELESITHWMHLPNPPTAENDE